MGGVDDDSVGTGTHQGLHALQRVGGDTNAGSHAQTAFGILAGHGLVLGLGDVLIGDEAHETVVLVHHGQFLYLVLLQDVGSCHQVGLLMGGHEVVLRHDLIHGTVQAALEAQVTVGDDTHQPLLIIDDGDTADVVLGHDVEGLRHRRT